MSTHEELEELATRTAGALSRLVGIELVHLYGSLARREATSISDIDILVVARSEDDCRTLAVEIKRFRVPRVTLSLHTWSSLKPSDIDWLFLRHLVQDGRTLWGDADLLRRELDQEPPPDEQIVDQVEAHFAHLRRFDDLSQYDGRFFFSAAHLYRVVRSAVLLGNARTKRYDFDRSRAFIAFARRHRELARDIDLLSRLEAFYLIADGRAQIRAHADPDERSIRDGVAAAHRVITAAAR